MSHIQVELDALHKAADVAALTGVDDDVVIAGLNRLWVHCYREKTDTVSDSVLRAKFKGKVQGLTLAEFGFVEWIPPQPGSSQGSWKVKGTGRYTRAQEARSKGGKAAKGNLIPGAVHRLKPKRSRKSAEAQPKEPLGSASALDPKSEILNPREETTFPASPVFSPTVDLRDRLENAFSEERGGSPYGFAGGRDGKALVELLKLGSADEIESRWRRALKRPGYPNVGTFHGLVTHWNLFATDQPAGARDTRKAPVRAEDAKPIPSGEIDVNALMAARGL